MIDQTYSNRYRKAIGIIIFISICFLAVFFLICAPVSAGQTMNSSLNVTEVTPHSITWQIKYKTEVRATGAIFDGVEVEGFNGIVARNFTVDELEPNTTHEFCIYKDLINCEKGTTLATSETTLLDYAGIIALFICAIICLIVGAVYERFVSFGALVFGAIISSISMGSNLVVMILGLIIALSSIFVAFRDD